MEPASFNFTSFNKDEIKSLPEDKFINKKVLNHPEYGVLPYNTPCTNCFEIIEKRTENTRYFIEKESDGKTFIEQTGYGPIHVKDANNNWVSLSKKLLQVDNGIYAAQNQSYPFSANLNTAEFALKNQANYFKWNKNLELIRLDSNGIKISLGIANLSNHTAGDDGIKIINAWPGIDIEIISLLGSIHTDFIFNVDPGKGTFLIKDHLDFSDELNLVAPKGKFSSAISITNKSGQEIFNYDRAFAVDKNGNIKLQHYLDYSINDKEITIYFNRDEVLQAGLNFPITIDPLVTTTATLPQASITGSGYNAFCWTGGCTYNLTVNSPANAIITGIAFSFNYISQGGCAGEDGAMRITYNGCTSPSAAGFFWTCQVPTSGPCNGSNLSIFTDVQSCIPAPSCAPYAMNFGLQFFRCFGAGGGCSNTCIGANSPWTMAVTGKTLQLGSAFPTTATICQGASTNLNATGLFGIPPLTYNWSPGGLVGSPVSVSPASTTLYTVVITDACGQTVSQNVNLNVTPTQNPGFTIAPNPACIGEAITVTGLGAGAATAYDWLMPGANNATINNQQNVTGVTYATAGTNNITLNYAVGSCIFPSVLPITISASPASPVFTSNAPICVGAQLTFDGPTMAAATYSWSGPNGFVSALEDPVINNVTAAAAGVYTLTITVSSCSSTATLNITINNAPTAIVVTPTSTTCGLNNGAITLGAVSGGAVPYTYSVDGSAYTATLIYNGFAIGNYQVIVQDNNGCTFSTSTNIVDIPGLTAIVVNTTNTNCGQSTGTITLGATTGGVAPYTYSVNASGYTNTLVYNNFAAGTYTVIVKDANGCTFTTTTTVNTNGGPSAIAIAITNETCTAANGSVSLGSVTGGAAPYQYNFNSIGLSATTIYNNLSAGNYTIIVVDNNGCSYSTTALLTNTASPTAIATTVLDATCSLANGSVTLGAVTGGTAPYQYNFNGLGLSANNVYTGLLAGNYSIIVSDNSNCTFSTNVTVNNTAGPTALQVNTNPSFCGLANGSLTIGAVTGGTAPFSYSVDNSAFTNTIVYNNLVAGNYITIVSDANGCTFAVGVNILNNSGPTAIVISTGNTTCGAVNGSVTLGAVTNGLAPFQYDFNGLGFSNTTVYNGLAIGNYPVIVQDANGCTYATSANVIDSPSPTAITINATNQNCGLPNGTITLGAVTNGTAPFQYNFNNAGFSYNTSYINLVAGNYSIIVQDVNGCIFNTNTVIANNPGPTNLVLVASDATCGGADGIINIGAVTGGTAPYQYNFGGLGYASSTSYNNLPVGTYQVDVIDNNGCTFSASSTVSSSSSNGPSAIEINTTGLSCGETNGTITLGTVSGGTYPFYYSLNNAGFNNNTYYSDLEAGDYSIAVRDNNGCLLDTAITVLPSEDEESVYIPNAFTPNGDELNDTWKLVANCAQGVNGNVFNRWGQKIYTFTSLEDSWDGGSLVNGVYVYSFDVTFYSGKVINYSGKVIIVK